MLAHGGRVGARRVTSVVLRVGELNDLEPEWIQRYFDFLSEDTMAEGARIEVRTIPIVIECAECGEETRITREQMAGFACPACGCEMGEMVAGREIAIDRIEIEQ